MVRDVLSVEALRRNRALVTDGFTALVECAGSRPTSAANTGMDHVEELLYWCDKAPMMFGDFSVDPIGLNGGAGVPMEGEHISKLQVRK